MSEIGREDMSSVQGHSFFFLYWELANDGMSYPLRYLTWSLDMIGQSLKSNEIKSQTNKIP